MQCLHSEGMGRGSYCLIWIGVLSVTVGHGRAHAGSASLETQVLAGDQRAAAATHSVRGLVAFIDESHLVLARSSRRAEVTIALNQSTVRSAPIHAGADVSVRYRIDGNRLVAVAVFVHPHSRGINMSSSGLHARPILARLK